MKARLRPEDDARKPVNAFRDVETRWRRLVNIRSARRIEIVVFAVEEVRKGLAVGAIAHNPYPHAAAGVMGDALDRAATALEI